MNLSTQNPHSATIDPRIALSDLLPAGAATDSFDPSHEPTRGGVSYPALAALPGSDQLDAFLTGRAPAPPVARLTGRRIVDASCGSATYALRSAPRKRPRAAAVA